MNGRLRLASIEATPGAGKTGAGKAQTSRALPWFESYVGRHRSSQMPLRSACLVTFNEGTVMIGFMESVV
jgi:hypothetical protein